MIETTIQMELQNLSKAGNVPGIQDCLLNNQSEWTRMQATTEGAPYIILHTILSDAPPNWSVILDTLLKSTQNRFQLGNGVNYVSLLIWIDMRAYTPNTIRTLEDYERHYELLKNIFYYLLRNKQTPLNLYERLQKAPLTDLFSQGPLQMALEDNAHAMLAILAEYVCMSDKSLFAKANLFDNYLYNLIKPVYDDESTGQRRGGIQEWEISTLDKLISLPGYNDFKLLSNIKDIEVIYATLHSAPHANEIQGKLELVQTILACLWSHWQFKRLPKRELAVAMSNHSHLNTNMSPLAREVLSNKDLAAQIGHFYQSPLSYDPEEGL